MGRSEAQPTIDALRRQVDALAMTVMFREDPTDEASSAEILKALSEIAHQAAAAGWETAAGIAAELKRELETNGGADEERAALQLSFQSAIVKLQEALEEGPIAQDETPTGTGEASGESPGQPALPPNFDLELLTDFFLEAREHLGSIETQLLALERDPNHRDAVHTIFRAFHTIKGLAGFLELPVIQNVAHDIENVLDLARGEKLAITPEVIDFVLAAADYLKTELQNSETAARSGKAMRATDSTQLRRRIQGLVSREPGAQKEVKRPTIKDAPLAVEIAPKGAAEPQVPAGTKKFSAAEAGAIKVDTGKLDFLVDMVGEMVIAQSLLRHDALLVNPRLQRNLTQLSRITGEVQKTAMSMRMVPVGQLFSRMARLVRDLSRKGGIQADLSITGEDTELDRTIVEDLADPLMHMVRNSADHGIEPIEDRVKAGKHRVGQISLKAYHQAGYITIEVSDDGRGLDREKILNKARKKGLVADGGEPSDAEVFNLIFEPGFSTAEQVTDMSGRGVGMDVVRKQVQKMRGRIDIRSEKGLGTTFFIKLPITLAIIDGLVVGVGGERYIVPIFAVREMLRPSRETVKTVQGRSEMVLVRESLLPVVRLHQRFGVKPKSNEIEDSLLIIAETTGKTFCLMVDEFIGKQEVVIKNLGEMFKHLPGVAGGAILGDGRIGLILDMDGLAGENADE